MIISNYNYYIRKHYQVAEPVLKFRKAVGVDVNL